MIKAKKRRRGKKVCVCKCMKLEKWNPHKSIYIWKNLKKRENMKKYVCFKMRNSIKTHVNDGRRKNYIQHNKSKYSRCYP